MERSGVAITIILDTVTAILDIANAVADLIGTGTEREVPSSQPVTLNRLRLGDWLSLAVAADVAVVPAQRLGTLDISDLRSLTGHGEDRASPEGEAEVARMAQALREADGGVLRWDCGCLGATHDAVRSGRRPEGFERGYTSFEGRCRPSFRDSRLAAKAMLWPGEQMTAWLRPWVEPGRINGTAGPRPEVWRVYLGLDGIVAASLYHRDAALQPGDAGQSGCAAALDGAVRVLQRMRSAGAVGDTAALFALDFLVGEDGRSRLLDGGVPPLDGLSQAAWRCAFTEGAPLAGIAIGGGRIVPLPQALGSIA